MAQDTAKEYFKVGPGDWQGEPVMVLEDLTSGAKAMVAPNLGSNCVYWATVFQGQTLSVIETPDGPEVLHARGSRAGVPVLFPFPGRVENASYTFQGKEYHLPRNEKGGVHHIHGIVMNAKWEVASSGTGDQGANLVMKVTPGGLQKEFREGYPFDFALYLSFTLKGNSLTYGIRLENLEKGGPIPFYFGLHPYFLAPLLRTPEAPDREACSVLIPSRQEWPAPGGLPDGPARPVSPEKDLHQGRVLGNKPFDDMYGGAIFEGGWTRAGYKNPGTKLELVVKADQNFQNWVLFTPPNRPSLAIEPYTSPPNAINLVKENIPGANLLVLGPGEHWEARVIFEVKGL